MTDLVAAGVSPIRILSETLVNRIAAGEVIVKPASVIRELLDNSIDAGATRIQIRIENGARDLTVIDDGSGIQPQDAPLAFVRHATSKILEFDDLYRLPTRGFRGEALASIASVARVDLLTRHRANEQGTRISSDGDSIPRIEPAGAPPGTQIRVRELFFNTPARLKFLKSPVSETQQAVAMVVRQALVTPAIGFRVETDKPDPIIDVPPNQSWDERIAALLGSGIRENLLYVDQTHHDIRIRGYVLMPLHSRKDRRHQFFYVDQRPFTHRTLSFVLQDAYKGLIMVQRFPVCVLDIKVPDGDVDINVHPAKEEVRFRKETQVSGALHRAVSATLQAANLMPVMNLGSGHSQGQASPVRPFSNDVAPGNFTFRQPAIQDDMLPPLQQPNSRTLDLDFTQFTAHASNPFDSKNLERTAQKTARDQREADQQWETVSPAQPAAEAGSPQLVDIASDAAEEAENCNVRLAIESIRQPQGAVEDLQLPASPLLRHGVYPEPLGQISRCYIIAAMGPDMLLIDQHAAHERLMYLKFANQKNNPATQALLLPVSIDVPSGILPFMDRLIPLLQEMGLNVEPFGGSTFLVQTVPADLPNLNALALIGDLLDDYETIGRIEQVEILRDRIVTRMACRAAIKAGATMNHAEMLALIHDIANARLGFTCPHGRPTMILLTLDELDKQFKRKV